MSEVRSKIFPAMAAMAFLLAGGLSLDAQQVPRDEVYGYVNRLAESGEGFTNPAEIEIHEQVRSDHRDWESPLATIIDPNVSSEDVIETALAVLGLRGTMGEPKVEKHILPYLEYRLKQARAVGGDEEKFMLAKWRIASVVAMLAEHGGDATRSAILDYITSPEEVEEPLLSVYTLRNLSKEFTTRADASNLPGLQTWLKNTTDPQVRKNLESAIHRSERSDSNDSAESATVPPLPVDTEASPSPSAAQKGGETSPLIPSHLEQSPTPKRSFPLVPVLIGIAALLGLLVWLVMRGRGRAGW